MTWDKLIELEPRLKALLEKAQGYHKATANDKYFCANHVWYRKLKPELVELVGNYREKEGDPFLYTSEAYDLAYQTVYDALPNCRHESAFC